VLDGGKEHQEQVGRRLRDAIIMAGLNAAKVGAATGTSKQMMSLYLSGGAEPRFLRMVLLAKAVGVSVEWLATGAGNPFGGDEAVLAAITELEAVALDINRRLLVLRLHVGAPAP
jgi:transcriptional regulator with XRE-family HTH domain